MKPRGTTTERGYGTPHKKLRAQWAIRVAVQAAIISYLSPLTWGNVSTQGTAVNSWLNATSGFNVIRFNSLIGVIENVPGVQYVVNSSLKLGFSATPTGTADITMVGPAPLPTSTTSTVLISADN